MTVLPAPARSWVHSVDGVLTANPQSTVRSPIWQLWTAAAFLGPSADPPSISLWPLCLPCRFSPRLRVNPEVAWPTSTSSMRTCCPSSGAIMCSWKRRTPTNGLSRAGLPAARPVEEVSAIVVLWFLVGNGGGSVRMDQRLVGVWKKCLSLSLKISQAYKRFRASVGRS